MYTLSRRKEEKDGIFGELTDSLGNIIAYTLEHAYENSGSFSPKLPTGTYTCQRGPHRLEGMTSDFETFEIMNVPGHTDILFHWGNFNRDSAGCVLLGEAIAHGANGDMITNSRKTWEDFMSGLSGVDTFQLTVM